MNIIEKSTNPQIKRHTSKLPRARILNYAELNVPFKKQ